MNPYKETKSHKKSKTVSPVTASFKKAALAKRFGTHGESSPEVKYTEVQFDSAMSNAGQIQLLNGCVEGTAITNRIGQKIELTSVSVDFQLAGATLTTAQGFPYAGVDAVRVALVYDRQPNGAALTYANVFNNNNVEQAPLSKRNMNFTDRFEVLKSQLYRIDTASNISITDSWYISTKHDVRYGGSNNGDITDIETGSLYLIFADQGTVTTGTPLHIIGSVRCRFHDM